MVTTTASTIPAVVSSVKWLEDELELNALDNPGSRCGSGNEKAAAGQRTALSAALGGRVEVAAMSTISDLNIVIQEAVDILKVVEGANKLKGAEGPSGVLRGAQNAWDMLSDEQSQKHITTGSGDLDGILGGGIHCKEVTEIGGVPGIGKTQLGYRG